MKARAWLAAVVVVCGVVAFSVAAAAEATEGGIDRAGMAYIIARGMPGFDTYTAPDTATFPDVPTSYWAYREIEFGAAHDIWHGYGDGSFSPDRAVTRDQATVYLQRAAGLPMDPPATPTFSDVPNAPTAYWAYSQIEALAAAIGVATIQWSPGYFHPGTPITNLELAEWTVAVLGASGDPSAVPFDPAAVEPPMCDFTAAPTSGDAPLVVTFTDLSAGSPGPTSWSWSFGDVQVSTERNPTHTYTDSGSYTVTLSAANGGGANTTTKTAYILVTGPPTVSFSATPAKGTVPLTVGFIDTSPAGLTTWSWDFGDGGTSTSQNPVHQYLRAGKYTVSLTGTGPTGSATTTVPGCVLVTFEDMLLQPWAYAQVMACVEAGIVAGYEDGNYYPSVAVTRDQMAVYIARAMAAPTGDAAVPPGPETATFEDVPNTGYGPSGTDPYWAYRYIEYCVANDVVRGYSATEYRPTDPVTRDQMAVFVARAKGWVGIDDDMTTAPEVFPDVPAGHWAGTAIQACVTHSVVQGYGDGKYHPELVVTRDQMAVYVARAFALPLADQPSAYAGIYSASYGSGSPGYMTIVVDVLGNASLVIVDPAWGLFAGTGTVSEVGELTATAPSEELALSVTVSGQFTDDGGDLTASGSLTGAVSSAWTGRKIAEAGANVFAGSWTGSYSGSEMGTWQGTLQADGTLTATAQSPTVGTVTLYGTVAPTGYAVMEGSGTGVGGSATITWHGALYLQGETVVGAGSWVSSSGMSGVWTGLRQTGTPNAFAGTYAASYGTGSAGSMTIAVEQSGSASIVVVDPAWALFTGTGTVSASGALTAVAECYLADASLTISGQFSSGGTLTGSGSLSGTVIADWAGGMIAAPGVNAFAGNWSGDFSGDVSGTWQGTIQSNGSVSFSTQSSGADPMSFSGTVPPVGFVLAYGVSGPYVITWGGACYLQGGSAVCAGLWGSESGAGGDWEGARH